MFFVFLTACSSYLKPNKDGIINYEGSFAKNSKPLNEKSLDLFCKKINNLSNTLLKDSKNIYYSIIPDKTYFINDKLKEPFDYTKLESNLIENINTAKYINIFNSLTLQDYYNTDLHWKQENLQKVLDTLGEQLDFKINLQNFNQNVFEDYLGFYKDTEGAKKEPLYYLTNDIINNALVTNLDNEKITVYDTEKLNTAIAYDVFLDGATPLLKIDNPNSNTNKELIIFRDSFTSSLAPLLIDEYKNITLIDLRYFSTDLLKDYIEFKGQDVLFLYNTEVINNAFMLK